MADDQSPPAKKATTIHPPVFFGSAILIIAFVLFGALFTDVASSVFSAVQAWIVNTFGWLYLLAVAIFLLFALGLALSDHGQVRLGPDDSRPDYSYTSWFAMLFSAGMGIGLMFFGVAEPMYHYIGPPVGDGQTTQAAREAMTLSFFHWGLHAWAIYAVVGLSLAYFGFRHGLPLTIRSALYPLLGERIHGWPGNVVDVFAVLGTMFGVATSLGLGVMQVNAGLEHLFGVPSTKVVQLILIAVITLMATVSVVSGLDAGIKRISELNLVLALLLVIFVLSVGPTIHLLNALVQNVGMYFNNVVELTFRRFAYQEDDWMKSWTLFYWGWWIAWSPFVGMFIARVSRGRTIREFVVGVLFVPVGFTFIWLTVFGNTAIWLDMGPLGGKLTEVLNASGAPLTLFTMLEGLPLGFITALLATILVVTFFVTSSDSGSLVIDIITSGGSTEPPVWQRVFWALTEGVVAAVLLVAGGLAALQTAAIAAALPFTIIMLFICFGLLRGLNVERMMRRTRNLPSPAAVALAGTQVPWQARLKTMLHHATLDQAQAFLKDTVRPAFDEVATQVQSETRQVEISDSVDQVTLTVSHDEELPFTYQVTLRGYKVPTFAFPEFRSEDEEERYYRAEVLLDTGQTYDVIGFTREQIIADVVAHYDRHLHFLHLSRQEQAQPGPRAIEAES